MVEWSFADIYTYSETALADALESGSLEPAKPGATRCWYRKGALGEPAWTISEW